MTSKPTCTCEKATAPGGTVAMFIESCRALVFLAERPGWYWMPFHERTVSLLRMHEMPSWCSTNCLRSRSMRRVRYR